MNNNYYLRNSVTTYTVQKGDSLYSISKKFNTTPTTLMMLNNLSNTLLNIGQVLIVKKKRKKFLLHFISLRELYVPLQIKRMVRR